MICKTLARTVRFRCEAGNAGLLPPEVYWNFAKLVGSIRAVEPKANRCSILTFNYDLALDYALAVENIHVDYHIDGNAHTEDSVSLLKLHGSLNWRWSQDNSVVPILLARTEYPRPVGNKTVYVDPYEGLGAPLFPRGFHPHPKKTEPLIVPPTWNKTGYQRQIRKVWRRAALELSDAEQVFVCGFSLPETDLFFRYLLALGTFGRSRIKRFWVMNPCESVGPRFEALIGPHIKRAYDFLAFRFVDSVARLTARGKDMDLT